MAVPGVEPGSSGSQPLMLTTTPYDQLHVLRQKVSRQRGSNPRSTAYEAVALPLGHTGDLMRSYGVVVSISGCDPLDPGSTPSRYGQFL